MVSQRLATCFVVTFALAHIAVSGALAVEIPAKYRGVYTANSACGALPESESDVGEFPWLIVTKDTVYTHETSCSVTAVRRNVRRNADELTFACFAEGEKSTEKEIWSLEFEDKTVWGFKMSQPYLSKLEIRPGKITSGGEGRFNKCGLQAVPLDR